LPAAGEAADPAAQAESVFEWQRLARYMTRLTVEQREVLALRYGLDLSIRETAQQLGRSEGAVKQLQARAILRLSELMLEEPIPAPR
jgi:RNA polymerase sigma-70 factor (ECF subfamily)